MLRLLRAVGYGKVGDRYTPNTYNYTYPTYARAYVDLCAGAPLFFSIHPIPNIPTARYDTAVIIDVIIVILALLSLLIT